MRGSVVALAVRRHASLGACAALCLFLANCANSSRVDSHYSERVVEPGQPVPKGGGAYHVGQPYTVGGQVYVPAGKLRTHQATGYASWYGDDFHGRYTANGEVFDTNSISGAHPTLPLPSYVRVTNLSNGRSIIVRINDRGPYRANRIIDVSTRTAHLLGFYDRGVVPVRVEYVARAPIEGSDDRVLEATLRENEPAPAPNSVRLASIGVAPVPAQPPPVSSAHFMRSPAASGATAPVGAMSYAETPNGSDGTAQFLNGRGLY